jgi:hypothetical protein
LKVISTSASKDIFVEYKVQQRNQKRYVGTVDWKIKAQEKEMLCHLPYTSFDVVLIIRREAILISWKNQCRVG